MDLAAGTTVSDRYVIEAQIGEGGMAVVYRARHATLGTMHALKVLTMTGRAIRERMIQEGQVQARLRHPNIVAVTDVVDVNGSPALVMELVDGPSLDELVKAQKLTLEQADAIGRGVVAGVAHAHAHGLVHRDLKPANVMLQIDNGLVTPKVTDFGLAKVLAGEDSRRAATRTGSTMGTPQYMSPEQIKDAKSVDARSDVFACGAILYEILTGERAFDADNILEIFERVSTARYRPALELRPDAPERMLRAIDGALQADPTARLPTAGALYAAWTDGEALAAHSLSAASIPELTIARAPSVAPASRSPSAESLAVLPAPTSAPPSPRSLAPTLFVGGGLIATIAGIAAVAVLLIGVIAWWSVQRAPVVVQRTVVIDGRTVPVDEATDPAPVPDAATMPDPATVPDPTTAPDVTPPTPAPGVAVPAPAPDATAWADLTEEQRTAEVVILDPEPVPATVPEPVPEPEVAPGPAPQAGFRIDQLPSSLRTGTNRSDAINRFIKDNDPNASAYLAALAEQDPNPTIRWQAFDALMQRWELGYAPTDIPDRRARAAMQGADARWRDRALTAYTRRGSSLQYPGDLLAHRDASVRRAAIEAVVQVGLRTGLKEEARRLLAPRVAAEAEKSVKKALDSAIAQLL